MKTYLVSYDLINKKKYAQLADTLKTYSAWAKPLESVWLIRSNESASDIRHDLKMELDNDDKLIVIEVTNMFWATYNISAKVTEWMKIYF